MIKLKSLIPIKEAFCPPKQEFDAAEKRSEYGIFCVILDKTGKIYIDDWTSSQEVVPRENVLSKVKLYPKNKEVDIFKTQLHGNKIDSGTQQLIASLLKNKVIDSSWKVSFSDNEGYYLGGEYVNRHGEFEGLPPNFWKRNTRVDVGEKFSLYHGTSEKELPTILQYGLRPLGSKYTSAGGETRLRVEENKNVFYLTGTFQDAFRYAQLKARWNMRAQDKDKYSYVEHWEWERWFIKPVVLLVRIPDFTKLRSDDDRIISLMKTKGDEIWGKMPPEEKQKQKELSVQWFKERGINYDSRSIESYLWMISDNGFQTVLKYINKKEWDDWKSSLKGDNQVGYQGVIPPNYIQVLDLYKTVKVPRNR